MDDVWRIHDITLRRQFSTGRLMLRYRREAGLDNRFGVGGYVGKFVDEPLSDDDKALIGDTPIPPKVAKVDL